MHHWSTLIGKTSNTSSCQLFTLGFISCRHFKLSSLESVWWYFKPLLHIPLLALLISVCSGEPCTTETHRLFVRQNFSHSLQVTSCHISFPQSASFLSALYTILEQAIINSADSNVQLPVCSYSQKLHTSGLYQLPTSYPVVASNDPSRAVALATTGVCIQENYAPLKHTDFRSGRIQILHRLSLVYQLATLHYTSCLFELQTVLIQAVVMCLVILK